MKKFLAILFVIALSFTLWSCGSCTEHVDSDGDLKCDECEAPVECTNHTDTVTDGFYKCDKCGAAMSCPMHIDNDDDLSCDECGERLKCKNHVDTDKNNECDKCYIFVPCEIHTDGDDNLTCDKCNADIYCSGHVDAEADNVCDECQSKLSCTVHKDANDDGKCDKCSVKLPCISHKDSNRDLLCDRCSAPVKCTHIDENNDSICDVEKCKWNYDHAHGYASSWSKDAEKHWHAPTCGHTIPNIDEAAHTDDDNNGICDVCEYQMCDHPGSIDEGWCSDSSGHWRPLTCGHNAKPHSSKISPHSFDLDGLCECGYKIDHKHTFETVWSTTETEHFRKSNCGHTTEETDRGAHIDEDVYDGLCDTCGYVLCEHPYEDKWSRDDTTHWIEPKCDHVAAKDVGEHTDGNNDAICDGCGWNYDHEHEYDWIIDASGHKKNLTCGHVIEDLQEGEHIDSDNNIICDVCGYNYGHEHTFSTEWSSDEDYHWHAGIGDCATSHSHVVDAYAKHTDANGNLICDVCGVGFEEDAPDLPEDGSGVIETPKLELG